MLCFACKNRIFAPKNLHIMPNPTNKQELLSAMADGYAKLNEQIGKMSEEGRW